MSDSTFDKDINIQAQSKYESLENSFGKYKISDFHQNDCVKFYWRWGKNRGIHEGTVLVVNSFFTYSTIDVMSEGVLYKELDVYYVIKRGSK